MPIRTQLLKKWRGGLDPEKHIGCTPLLVADAHWMCSVRTTLVYCFNWLRKYDVLFVNSQRGHQIAVTAIRYWRHSTRRIRLWFDCSVFCCNCTVSRATYSRSLFHMFCLSMTQKLKNDDTTLVIHLGSFVVQSSFALIQSIQSVNHLFVWAKMRKTWQHTKNSTLSDEFIHGRRNRRCKGDIVHLSPHFWDPGGGYRGYNENDLPGD